MPSKTFAIESYVVSTGYGIPATWNGVTIKAQAYLACYGSGGDRLIAYFLAPDSPVPQPIYDVPRRTGAIFLPFSDMAPYVDLVRNESPVFAHLNSEHPEWIALRTAREPVGEEES